MEDDFNAEWLPEETPLEAWRASEDYFKPATPEIEQAAAVLNYAKTQAAKLQFKPPTNYDRRGAVAWQNESLNWMRKAMEHLQIANEDLETALRIDAPPNPN